MSDASLAPRKSAAEGLATHASRAFVAAIATAVLLGVMWLLEVMDYVLGEHTLDTRFGIQAHDVDGLPHIFTAPFMHADPSHLLANSGPLIVLGFLAALRGFGRFIVVSLIIMIASGLGVWFLAAPDSLTVGASGLIFGYFGYLLGRGLFERRLLDIFIAVVVVVLYGTMLFGVLPTNPYISWQAHLFGLIGGVLAAWVLRRRTSTA